LYNTAIETSLRECVVPNDYLLWVYIVPLALGFILSYGGLTAMNIIDGRKIRWGGNALVSVMGAGLVTLGWNFGM
jgi:hypothetical protein